MGPSLRRALLIGGLIAIAIVAGFAGGFAGSFFHPGPPGPRGEAADPAGCWSYDLPNRTSSINTICLVRKQ